MSNIQAYKVPRNAEGIDPFFKTVRLEQWSLWSFGHEHPQKLFSVLRSRYLQNIKHIQELGNADVARHAKGLATEAKRCRAHQWKQILGAEQVKKRVLCAGGAKVTPRTLRRERCWKVSGFNVSLALHKYRNRSIDLLNQGDTLNTLRRVSLNGIFLVKASPLPSPSPPPSAPTPPPQQAYGVADTVWHQALAESKDGFNTLPAVSVDILRSFMAIEDHEYGCSESMSVDDTDEQQQQQQQQQSTFETPEFMTDWTEKQKSEFAFQLLTSLPPNEVIQIVDRISPYLHRNILSQLPYEIAIEILGFLDVSSLIQASQVSRGWHALCEEQSLWRNLFEQQGWGYDREEMDIYISNIPDEEDYHAHSSSGGSSGGGSSHTIAPLPIVRTSSPLIGKSKWSRLYTMKNRPIADTKSIRKIKRFTLETLGGSHGNPHYDPASDTRYINWQALYQNRLKIERRWKDGSCKVRMFPPATCPVPDLHTEGIYCIQFDKEKMVTGSRDRTIKIWDIQSGRCKMTLRGHTGSVLCLQYDAQYVVSGSSDTSLIVTDIETGAVKRTLSGHTDSVLSLRLVNKDQIISCSKDRTLRLWNKHTGECIRQFNGHRAAVNAVQWHDNRVVSASGDRTIKIWDLNTGACLKTLESHTRGVACVEFDGTFIVSGSSDQTIKVWDATSGECVYTLVGHTELVRTIQLDPVAKRIISGCYNGHLKIWSLDEGRALRDLGQATEGRILNLKFDFTKIACCSNLVKIVIYDFADGIDTKFLL